MIKGNLVYGQSGGPTAVINATAAGVFLEALSQTKKIDKVFGAKHGILGVLNEDFVDIGQEDRNELWLLQQTPSSILGSCRYKLEDPDKDDSDYLKILEVFKKYNIRYFLYNGGNDSMDTCSKISKFLRDHDYECQVIGVPKTIDNDLAVTDHCPGYGSAAKYIATTMMEIYKDAIVYERGQITIVEIMGRNAGWLTAAASIAQLKGYGPDLIYLPEKVFDIDQVIQQCKEIYEQNDKLIVALSEGVRTADGTFLPELESELSTDAFGHKQMGGAAQALVGILEQHIPTKYRHIEFSLMQRCSAHLAAKQDVDDAFLAGREAVKSAINGETDVMIGFKRPDLGLYQTDLIHIPLDEVANLEKKVPVEWIKPDNTGMEDEFFEYALPLIKGRPDLVLDELALPRFAELKLVKVEL